jgi:16S rRNA (uracil1498-N3)-methyltransferase
MHRFFINHEDQVKGSKITLKNDDLVHQLSKVLRFKPEQKIIIIDSKNHNDLVVNLEEFSKKEIHGTITEVIKVQNEPAIKLHLYFANLKNPDKVELILQKCTEIGVTEFTPIITARTEKKHLPKPERLIRILTEAAEQSGRTQIPILNEIKEFKECVKMGQNNFIASPHHSPNQIELDRNEKQEINLFIGPEGGFTEEEIQECINHNFKTIHLGNLILRAETASIVGSSKILI